MSDRVVVLNVANGSWFPNGQTRLRESLALYPAIAFKGWSNEYPPGCEPHSMKPYEFKRAAIEWASRQGYDIAIWADASCWFIKDPKWLVQTVKDRGYWFCTLGWNTGQWCSDKALIGTNYTRDELFKFPMVAATFYALDLRHRIGNEYLKYMKSKQQYFAGPYRNENNEASSHPDVLGHRHDQTFLSVFAHEYDLIIDKPPCFFDYATQREAGNPVSAVAPHDTAVVIAQGM